MYFTDQGIEELAQRRADDEVSLGWLAERLREFVDQSPEFEAADRPPRQLASQTRRRRRLTPTGISGPGALAFAP